MNKTLLAGFSGVFCFSIFTLSITVFAADDPLTIVVTASRSAETVDESMAPVTVIDRRQIEKTGALSVPQVLATVPGLTLSNNGGAGKTTSVFLRGTESDHVLVLIDGVKAGSASLGTTPFQDLPLSQVEKIEIVRGPRSSLYGSEAIGGVIQIFTRKGGKGTRPTFGVSAGSHNSSNIELGISGGTAGAWYTITGSNYQTDGFDACVGNLNGGCFADEPDDDGYENTAITLRGGGQITDRLSIEGGILNAESETEFDGSFQNESESLTRTSHVKAALKASDSWDTSLLIANSKDESENYLNGEFASRFDTDRDQVSWQNDLLLGVNKFVFGIDYIKDEVDSDNPFTVSSRDNTGVFGLLKRNIGGNDFEFSLRNDDNEQFGNESTGGIAFGRDLNNNKRIVLSYGTAFKAPTFNELYFPGFGNPDLVAETSGSIDLGFSGRGQNRSWSMNLFYTEIEDLISFDPVTFAPVNIGKAEISGIEFSASTAMAGWNIIGNLTLQDPKDASGGINDGNQLARRPKQIFQISADRAVGDWTFGGSVLSRGDSFDDLGNVTKLDQFTVLDLRAGYRVHAKWMLSVNINNALDEEYETAAFFNQDGVNALATLRYLPK